ncbi:MAG: glycosyltransferase family 2 protein [Clostridia bacterium]|nr:glycosyltransferase family 2 protein [Clostridia bacterium]
MKNDLIVIIPAYEPTREFIQYALAVSERARRVVIVNDGSSEAFDGIFGEIAKIENVVYLKHEKNLGKGCALKTAFAYCVAHFESDAVIVTADCDGQHAVEDVSRVGAAVTEGVDRLVLGSRDFTLANIPPKSQIGNRIFRRAFRFFYRKKVYDTQTGLRGFSVALAKEFAAVKGKRFEYEMTVLIYAKKNGLDIFELPIQTIYPDEPKDHATHYRPIKDTLKIYSVVLKNLWMRKNPSRKKKR